jgi:chromosome segregation ATPase
MSEFCHDTETSVCLCSSCVDSISDFVSCVTNLEQAHAVIHHVVEKHQSQLIQTAALKSILADKDPEIQILRQKLDIAEEQLYGYQEYDNPSQMSMHTRNSSTSSRSSTNQELIEEVARLKQKIKANKHAEHPYALRLKAAVTQYANQVEQHGLAIEEDNRELYYLARRWKDRCEEMQRYEQFVIDSQIYREMQQAERIYE